MIVGKNVKIALLSPNAFLTLAITAEINNVTHIWGQQGLIVLAGYWAMGQFMCRIPSHRYDAPDLEIFLLCFVSS